jgi:hypothetical protein
VSVRGRRGPAVVQVRGRPRGERVGARAQSAGHVRREQVVPLIAAGQAPLAQLVGLQDNLTLSLRGGDESAVEDEVRKGGPSVGLRRNPVDGEQPARLQVQSF